MSEEVKDETIKQQETKTTFTKEEVDALVSGLKANNEKLLSEKKAAAAAAKEAADAKLKAEQERAKQNGELEAFEKTLRSQYEPVLAEKDGKISKMAERILGAERKSVISQLSGMLIDESAADIIAQIEKRDLLRAISSGDVRVLTSLKGVGKKTAERIVLELRDRVGEIVMVQQAARGIAIEKSVESSVDEAKQALLSLGFTARDVERLLGEVANRNAAYRELETGDLVKQALSFV